MILNRTGDCWSSFRFKLISSNLIRIECRNWKVEGLWKILDLKLN